MSNNPHEGNKWGGGDVFSRYIDPDATERVRPAGYGAQPVASERTVLERMGRFFVGLLLLGAILIVIAIILAIVIGIVLGFTSGITQEFQ